MAFLNKAELKSAIYDYQLAEITEADSDIAEMAIDAAVSEMKGYLRSRYDVAKIFSAESNDRNALVLEMCKSMAVWYLIRLANVDMLHERVKERYDRAIDWLKQVNAGTIAPDLPTSIDAEGEVSTRFKFGSNIKFNSHY